MKENKRRVWTGSSFIPWKGSGKCHNTSDSEAQLETQIGIPGPSMTFWHSSDIITSLFSRNWLFQLPVADFGIFFSWAALQWDGMVFIPLRCLKETFVMDSLKLQCILHYSQQALGFVKRRRNPCPNLLFVLFSGKQNPKRIIAKVWWL